MAASAPAKEIINKKTSCPKKSSREREKQTKDTATESNNNSIEIIIKITFLRTVNNPKIPTTNVKKDNKRTIFIVLDNNIIFIL